MHNLLSLKRITAVSLVDAGANHDRTTGEGAHILLRKMDDGTPPASGRQRLLAALQASQGPTQKEGKVTTATTTKADIYADIRKQAREMNPDLGEAVAITAFMETPAGRSMHDAYDEASGEVAPPVVKKASAPLLGLDVAAEFKKLADAIAQRSGGSLTPVAAEEAAARSAEGVALYAKYQAARQAQA